MNGSTNGVVGFNPDNLVRLMNSLNSNYAKCNTFLSEIFTVSGTMMFQNMSSITGWYAPEAVEFEKNVLIPMQEAMSNEIRNLHTDLYLKLQNSSEKWSQTTGSATVLPQGDMLRSAYESYAPMAKMTDSNGNISVSPNLIEILNKAKTSELQLCDEELKNSLNYVKQNSVFLGAGQQDELIKKLEYLHRTMHDKAVEYYDKAISKVTESINKYQAIARQVAANFNSGVVESATASVNNGQ